MTCCAIPISYEYTHTETHRETHTLTHIHTQCALYLIRKLHQPVQWADVSTQMQIR